MKLLIVILLGLLAAIFEIAAKPAEHKHHNGKQTCTSPHWVYHNKYANKCNFAVKDWHKMNSDCTDTAKNRPSPIKINTRKCKRDKSLQKLKLGAGFFKNKEFTLVNNGHSLKAIPKDNTGMTVSGGNLDGEFQVAQFHFHWGSVENQKNGIGSEHEFYNKNGKQKTPVEIHIVCLKKGSKDPVNTPDDVAVLGAFFNGKKQSGDNNKADSSLHKIVKKISKLKKPAGHGHGHGNHEVTTTLTLRNLLPKKLKYVNYDGAFTTPNCNPVVQWHVMRNIMTVRPSLLKKFTKLFFDEEKTRPMEDNFRPVQKLHGRQLRCN